ncbi:phosphoesterase family protein [archaeon BMS3Bbin15]|nr:phosphoesterase family protein [archaeon BMS3Bbin15]
MLSTRYRIFAISLAVLIVFGVVVSATAAIPSATEKIKPFDHVFVIVMENQGTESIIGDPEMPFTNYIAQTYGYADNYYGVTHPSMPNYIAMTSGSDWYSHSDNANQMFPHANLADEMEAAGLSWKGYMESLPYAGYTGATYPLEYKEPAVY